MPEKIVYAFPSTDVFLLLVVRLIKCAFELCFARTLLDVNSDMLMVINHDFMDLQNCTLFQVGIRGHKHAVDLNQTAA